MISLSGALKWQMQTHSKILSLYPAALSALLKEIDIYMRIGAARQMSGSQALVCAYHLLGSFQPTMLVYHLFTTT